jgi:hypothetical protein
VARLLSVSFTALLVSVTDAIERSSGPLPAGAGGGGAVALGAEAAIEGAGSSAGVGAAAVLVEAAAVSGRASPSVAEDDVGDDVVEGDAGWVERGVPSPGAERADLSLDKERCWDALLLAASGLGTADGAGAVELEAAAGTARGAVAGDAEEVVDGLAAEGADAVIDEGGLLVAADAGAGATVAVGGAGGLCAGDGMARLGAGAGAAAPVAGNDDGGEAGGAVSEVRLVVPSRLRTRTTLRVSSVIAPR